MRLLGLPPVDLRARRLPRLGRPAAAAALVATSLVLWRQLFGTCALLPAPPSKPFARAPTATLDRWPFAETQTSILPEPVERPLERYLHKLDRHYNRVVPDWQLQYTTAEQQYLYEGEFAVFVREVTEQGAIVQDAVTGISGFVHSAEFGGREPIAGALLQGARCTHLDMTVVMSPAPEVLRLQTGVVYEWDEVAGHGYIIPTEGQDAWRMLRVLRRDILWHGSRRLSVGQFVQFETALPGEVPIEENDEPLAPFALRVRSPEVHFTLEHSYGTAVDGESDYDAGDQESSSRSPSGRFTLEPDPGRPTQVQQRTHPVLQRWMEASPQGNVESPAWLWEPPMEYEEDEDEDSLIIPLQLKKMPRPKPFVRLLTHEVAATRGDLWKEPAQRRGRKQAERQKPPGRAKMERISLELDAKRQRQFRRERRQEALGAAGPKRRKRLP